MQTQSLKNNLDISLIQTNIPLADKTWFQTGGAAKLYAAPKNFDEFVSAVAYAQSHNEPIFILGHGANILISDAGFDGLVIHPQLNQISQSGTLVTAQAGASLADVITYCLDQNLIGLEEFSGIPGTVGGAVFINLHYFEFLLSQFIVSAQIIEKKTGTIHIVDTAWFQFGYDQSKLHEQEYYLLEATFSLQKGSDFDVAFARGRRHEMIRHRARRYPQSRTCGSFFRNFHPEEVTLEQNGKKIIYVAYYLDKIGVKGTLSINGAQVSYQHANMITHDGTAHSSDIIAVARTMQERVFHEFGIIPQPECQLIGFKEWPLVDKL